jgi:hypothetical protein
MERTDGVGDERASRQEARSAHPVMWGDIGLQGRKQDCKVIDRLECGDSRRAKFPNGEAGPGIALSAPSREMTCQDLL